MKRVWSDTLSMVVLGVITILVVIGGRQLFVRPATKSSIPTSIAAGPPHDDTVDRRLDRIERTLEKLQLDVKAIEGNHAATSTEGNHAATSTEGNHAATSTEGNHAATSTELVNAPPSSSSPSSDQDSLKRGFDYVSQQTYDGGKHGRILADLVAGYAIAGLSPEMNNALVTTIKQVNDIGVAHALEQSRSLPHSEAVNQLRVFLATTPKLTIGQKSRINAAITAHRNAGGIEK